MQSKGGVACETGKQEITAYCILRGKEQRAIYAQSTPWKGQLLLRSVTIIIDLTTTMHMHTQTYNTCIARIIIYLLLGFELSLAVSPQHVPCCLLPVYVVSDNRILS